MYIVGTASFLYPAIIHSYHFYDENETIYINIHEEYPFQNEWGNTNIEIYDELLKLPNFELKWISLVEQKIYHIKLDLKAHFNAPNITFKYNKILFGMAPYGGIALWARGFKKSVLVNWLKGSEMEVPMEDFHPISPNITLKEYCGFYINKDLGVKDNLQVNGLPPLNLFDKYMQQFTYRHVLQFEKWNDGEEAKWQKYREDELKPRFEYIEESLFDGTFDKLHDDGLQKYHEAGKPKKLAIKWHIKKTEYTAYFWFEDEKICSIFERFYGAHPDTKTDFIIRIDAEKKKYELALFRQGLKEPQIIPEDAYQLLVFKNKFEDYRSDNYNQERGAWIW